VAVILVVGEPGYRPAFGLKRCQVFPSDDGAYPVRWKHLTPTKEETSFIS